MIKYFSKCECFFLSCESTCVLFRWRGRGGLFGCLAVHGKLSESLGEEDEQTKSLRSVRLRLFVGVQGWQKRL